MALGLAVADADLKINEDDQKMIIFPGRSFVESIESIRVYFTLKSLEHEAHEAHEAHQQTHHDSHGAGCFPMCPELGASLSDASTLSGGFHSDRWNVPQAAPSRTLRTLRLGELWRAAIVCSWHNKKVKEDIGSISKK